MAAERRKQRGKGAEPERGAAASKPEAQAAKEAAAKREARAKSGGKHAETKAAQKTEERAASQTKAKAKSGGRAKPKAKAAEPTTKVKPKPKVKTKAEPEAPQRPVVRARARYVRVAPRKVRLVADQIRGLAIDDARSLLQFSARGPARDLQKLIDSAAANAENNHDLIADDLRVAEIRVDEGPTLRRYRPRALGRATRIDKRTSHISVALVPED